MSALRRELARTRRCAARRSAGSGRARRGCAGTSPTAPSAGSRGSSRQRLDERLGVARGPAPATSSALSRKANSMCARSFGPSGVGREYVGELVGVDVRLAQQHRVAARATARPGASRRGSRSPSVPGRRRAATCSMTNGAASIRKPDAPSCSQKRHDLLDLGADRGVGPVQVRLEVVEPVVVPGLGRLVVGPGLASARRGRRCPAGGPAARSSLQTYQSRYGESGSLRARTGTTGAGRRCG